MEGVSFKDYAIVACGTLIPELNYLKKTGWLDAKLLFTTPGLHQAPEELDDQLRQQIVAAKQLARKIIIVYGEKYCYINMRNPYRTIDTVIEELREEGYFISRTQVENCLDMLATVDEREKLAAGRRTWWCTSGWLKYRGYVFRGWDKANANENFGQYSEAIMLDPIGFFDNYAAEFPEEILDFADWASLPLSPQSVPLTRFQNILLGAMDPGDRKL